MFFINVVFFFVCFFRCWVSMPVNERLSLMPLCVMACHHRMHLPPNGLSETCVENLKRSLSKISHSTYLSSVYFCQSSYTILPYIFQSVRVLVYASSLWTGCRWSRDVCRWRSEGRSFSPTCVNKNWSYVSHSQEGEILHAVLYREHEIM